MQQNFLVVELVKMNISTVCIEESVKVNVRIIIYPQISSLAVCSNERVKADNKS